MEKTIKITPLYPKFISHSIIPKEKEWMKDRVKEIQMKGISTKTISNDARPH